MPNYTLFNNDTGEEEVHFFPSWKTKDEFLEENTNYKQKITAPRIISESGEPIVRNTSSDWKDHLKRMKKGSGRSNTINTL
jgi:glutathionyl-hydroquinone reductase